MEYTVGRLVRHPTFGLGKVLALEAGAVSIFFRDLADNPRRISTSFPLEIPEVQSDPWLDNLDIHITKPTRTRRYMTHQQAIERFLKFYPQGFHDPKYIGDLKQGERHYKWTAHELWMDTLGKLEFDRLLAAEDYEEIAHRASKVEGKMFLLLSIFEKAALRDAIKDPEAAKNFAHGLHDLIYGSEAFEARFKRFVSVLDGLPQPKSSVVKWPIQTIFPFLALPEQHLFLKPEVTKKAARRLAFSLNYQPRPNWLTYSCLLKFGQILMEDLAELKPRDMIDIQSFIWVTGDESYK